MKSSIEYSDSLPLEGASGYSRRIMVDSCLLDDEHLQIRAELVDNRADYEDIEKEIGVHGMVVRLTFKLGSLEITRSELALPLMAFKGICIEQMPANADELVGVCIGKGFARKVTEIFGGTRGCMHLLTLYKAVAMTVTQVGSWNQNFKRLDEDCEVGDIPKIMSLINQSVVNSCHAWAEDGGVSQAFANDDYEAMLQRCTPRLLGRWRDDKEV